jgi:hypothetical protein
MRVNLKLNAIEQEHLQELYDAAGVARDQLPYSEQFTKLCQDFQDRAFKNADPEQVYGALIKYVRSSTCASAKTDALDLSTEQIKQLKTVIKKHARAGKVLPYSTEFDSALKEFNTVAATTLQPRDFWMAIAGATSRSRKPGARVAKPVPETDDDDE